MQVHPPHVYTHAYMYLPTPTLHPHTQACTSTGTQRLLTGVQLDDVGGFGDDHITQFAAQGLG